MSVKSVELSMIETIPSQAGEKSPGVCNEHEPTAKAKMCSELHGDMKRLAEMISPAARQVTDSNTKYVYWRPHARRNMVPLDPDRFSVNQDRKESSPTYIQ